MKIRQILEIFKTRPLKAALFVLLFVSNPALSYVSVHKPNSDRYFLVGGASWAAGENFGRGAYMGVFKPTSEMMATGIAFGGFRGEKLIRLGDFFVALAPAPIQFLVCFMLGLGGRKIESGALLPQITHGVSVGPIGIFMSRYRGPKSQVREGLLTFTVPLIEFIK